MKTFLCSLCLLLLVSCGPPTASPDHQQRLKDWSATIEARLSALEQPTIDQPTIDHQQHEIRIRAVESRLTQSDRFQLIHCDVDLLAARGGMHPYKSLFLFNPADGTTYKLLHQTNGLGWQRIGHWEFRETLTVAGLDSPTNATPEFTEADFLTQTNLPARNLPKTNPPARNP